MCVTRHRIHNSEHLKVTRYPEFNLTAIELWRDSKLWEEIWFTMKGNKKYLVWLLKKRES